MKATVEIEWEGKKHPVMMETITFGEKNKLLQESIHLVKKGNRMEKEYDPLRHEVLQMVSSIKTAPFKINEKTLNEMPSTIGDQLYAVWKKLHEVKAPTLLEDETLGSISPTTTSD